MNRFLGKHDFRLLDPINPVSILPTVFRRLTRKRVEPMNVTGPLENLKIDRNPNRIYRVGTVASFEDIPASLDPCSPHFILLMALDASSLENERIRAIAKTLMSRGLAGFSVWGPDCSRVHDQFDIKRDPNETDERVIVTTWHENEPLSEAVCYFDLCAYPSADFERDCIDWVAIAVGNKRWAKEMRTVLINGFDGAE